MRVNNLQEKAQSQGNERAKKIEARKNQKMGCVKRETKGEAP